MAFFVSNALIEHQMVVGIREGVSKANKPYVSLSVSDDEGNVNSFSTSEPDAMAACRALQRGDYVDLRIVCAGGPQRQYAMIARNPAAIMPSAVR